MFADGELGRIRIKRVTRAVRKAIPKPIRRVAKVAARITPAALVFKPARRGLRKMVPKPVRGIVKRVAPLVPGAVLFKPVRRTAFKTVRGIVKPGGAISKALPSAKRATAEAGKPVTITPTEQAEAAVSLVQQGVEPGAAEQLVQQEAGEASAGEPKEEPKPEPAAGEEKATQAGIGGGIAFPLLLVGGVVAFAMFGQPKKRRR